MKVTGMNHFTVLTKDLAKTRKFYREVLGLKEGYRPELGFPGAWFYVGDHWLLHIVALKKTPNPPAGIIDHMAFSANDLRGTIRKLRKRAIKFELVQQVGTKVWQVFFHDPNGAKIELDFAPEEQPPPAH